MKVESIVALELGCLAFNIKKDIHDALDFIVFLKNYGEKKVHNMFLMLDPKVKNLGLMSSFICHEQNEAIVEKMEKKKSCVPFC
jgi:hypothetical protein